MRRKPLLLAAKSAFAALLLALVMAGLPWRDELTLGDATGTHAFAGTIIGNWRAAQVRFRLDDGVPADAVPAQWRAQFARSRTLELARSPSVDWMPGMPSVLRSVEPSGLALACGLLFVGVLLQTTRWWRLLAAVACPTRWWTALRLVLCGLFFSLVVPGQTGGDVVRALLVARDHPGRRAAAFVSVLVDRVLSLFVLAALGAAAILLEGERLLALRTPVLVAVCGGGLLAVLYTSTTARTVLDFRRRLERLPLSSSLLQIDDAFLVYRQQPGELLAAVLLSLFNHLCVASAIVVLGRAFGDSALTLLQYIAVSSVGNIASALPITPGGWGVGEAAYQYLFILVGGDGTIGVAVSIAFKLLFGLIGLGGGMYLLVSGGRRQLAEMRAAQART